MIDTLIIPGLNGSPDGHWQRHWVEEDPRADLVEQEDWAHPSLIHWLPALEERLQASQPGVVLVAHSLGCSLVAALADRPAASCISGALLVAPADLSTVVDQYPDTREFAPGHERPLPFASVLVASQNDPYMSFAAANRQAQIWGSALHDIGEAGHINIASGFGKWAEGRILAEGLRGRLLGTGEINSAISVSTATAVSARPTVY